MNPLYFPTPPFCISYWNVDFHDDTQQHKLTGREKAVVCLTNAVKVSLVFGFLYLFVGSLSFLADGFRLVPGWWHPCHGGIASSWRTNLFPSLRHSPRGGIAW
jgi:hypothetical protein